MGGLHLLVWFNWFLFLHGIINLSENLEKFLDRHEAGIILAECLKEYSEQANVILLALPRGGVPVAYEIAKKLKIPLDIFLVRKLGVPGHEELAMGAIASGGTIIFNEILSRQLNLEQSVIDEVVQAEQTELMRREHLYRGNRPFPDLVGKTILLVDDGMATGSTMRAAIKALHNYNPSNIIVAVPVSEYSTCDKIASLVDKMICPLKPVNFCAVGLWYENFPQTTDDEVIALLNKHQRNMA